MSKGKDGWNGVKERPDGRSKVKALWCKVKGGLSERDGWSKV